VSQWLVQHGAQSVEISFSERIAPAKGLSYGGKIKLLSGMQPAEDTKEKIPQHSRQWKKHAQSATEYTQVPLGCPRRSQRHGLTSDKTYGKPKTGEHYGQPIQ
jgi:hypothetical protein